MAAYTVKDFSDIIDAVVAELKLGTSTFSSTESEELNRIKRDINLVYKDEVAPYKRWKWLQGSTNVRKDAYLNNGTVSVTPDSATITFSTAPTTSKTGYLFSVEGYNEVYTISAHTANVATATLSTTYTGALDATATYKVWTNKVNLPTDCRETVEVYHDFYQSPMEPLGLQEFRRRNSESPKLNGRPVYYTTYDFEDPSTGDGETESDRYRVMMVYPGLDQYATTIHIDYIKEVSALDVDGDEPLMPIEDRIILVYGALERAWRRARNIEEAQINRQLFERKLALMAGRIEDSFDTPVLAPQSEYMARKRAKSSRTTKLGAFSGGGSYTAPSYLKNAIIEGATVTANVTVNTGITVDGRDLSVDGATLDALATLDSGEILVGNASNVSTGVTPTGDVTISNTGVTAIEAGVIVNADVNASAAIALSKLAATTASRALVSDGSGVVSPATTTATEIGYVNGVTSAIQTQIDAKAPLASPTFTGTVTTPVTASRAVVTGASSELAASATTATELGYVNGVTSAIQTQIDAKAPSASPTFSGTVTTPLTASRAMVTGASSELAVSAVTATELGYVSGVTSAIQTQIDAITSFDSSVDLLNIGLASSVGSSALTIALKQADASTDPSTGSAAVKIGFRSSTATSGAFNVRSVTGALSLVISSGSTLGQVDGQASRLYVYAIDNAGTVELAVSGTFYEENQLISTTAEGGAGAADSRTVIYSTTARSNVPFRLIGTIDNTQTTAGTWASAGTTLAVGNKNTTVTKYAPTIQRFTTATTGTYYTPAGVKYLRIKMVGGGGGGAGSGSGSPTAGGTGGDTTWKTAGGAAFVTASGGVGGTLSGPGGAGGAASIGGAATAVVSVVGGYGGPGQNTAAISFYCAGGNGGSSVFGGAGGGTAYASAPTAGAANTGGGGGGAGIDGASGQYSGGGGGSGGYTEFLLSTPLASYDYGVGDGGAVGSAGTSGRDGALGGTGVIIVEEYY